MTQVQGGGFDLRQDPRELHVVLPPDARVVQGLAQRERVLQGALAFRAKIGTSEQRIEIDADLQRRLHQLGYVDGGSKQPAKQ